MSVTITDTYPTGSGSTLVRWESSLESPMFYVHQDGVLIGTTYDTEAFFSPEPGEEFIVEIFDTVDDAPLARHPGRITLQWREVADAAYYLVEEYVGGEWVERKRIYVHGEAIFLWRSGFLADATTHQFRVTPVGTNGNSGTPKEFSVLMVRYPSPPPVDYSYSNSTHKVTLTAQ